MGQGVIQSVLQTSALVYPQTDWIPKENDVLYFRDTELSMEIRGIAYTPILTSLLPRHVMLTNTNLDLSNTIIPGVNVGSLLLENGGYLLLETSGAFLIEPIEVIIDTSYFYLEA